MEEIKIDLAVLKFLFNILRNQVLLEKEIPKDIFFQAQEYISSHNDTLKHTNIYKSYIKHQSSWRQNPQIIKSIQLTTNEKEKCIFLYKLFITSTRSFHPKLFYEFSNINEYQRSKWLNSKYKIPCNEWKIKNGILENLNKCLPGFKFLVEYDVNNIGQIDDEQLDDDKYELFDEKVDLSYGGMVFVSEVGVMIVIDLKYPRYKTGSFLEEKRSVTQMEYYRRYKCLNEQVISQKRIEKLKKIVEEKFEEKCIMVIGAKFIDESQLEFYDEFDKLIAGKIKELANITDIESIIKPVINTEENGTCETIAGYLIILIGFIIYMIIFVYSLKWDLETKEWDFIDVQDDDDVIVEILLALFQLIFCGNYTC
ncbi:unnamed protein product [Rhizophagus irregularis]|uniref:Uncharacterized protein n=1 Tax=Rhizophagus irregularis TaxID=588596 RepID=A0A2N1NXT3_9GLOM|nr:hypothetical protein RhiirC2_705614 [Rhizophagus irregularis]CAB4381462.1 unnamed protein product [Rhizophagus irregularis]CAB4405356.1 unnamed protein product [Rhizophagus irregularis]CAB5332655.1 unnamed protein product [Rhizophagus irregularis]